jgi:predicted ester cyclase
MSEANKELLRTWFERVWNQHSTAAIDDMFCSDGRSHGFPQDDSVLVGPEEFKTIHRNFCEAFPDIHVTVDDAIAEGDKLAVRWTATMTHLGDSMGIKATKRKVVLSGSTIVIIRDGMIREGWNFMDMGGLLAKLQAE